MRGGKIGRPPLSAPVSIALALFAWAPASEPDRSGPLLDAPESQVPLTPDPGVPESRRRKAPRRVRDRNHRFLPLPHISEQPAVGLMLGGSLNYSYRRPGEEFNQAYLSAWSRVSTRGVQDHILSGRVRDMLGRKEIFNFGLMVIVDPVFAFYGINNHANIAGTDITGSYNQSRMENYGGWLSYEHPLWRVHRPGKAVGTLRHYSGLLFFYDRVKTYQDSRMAVDNPELAGDARRGILRGGLSWDSRDNDWSPNEGSLIDVTVDVAGPYTASSTSWGRMHTSVRHYWPLADSGLLLAHRFTLDTMWGAPPLMALGEFGGLFPMDAYGGAFVGRGFARRRFIGEMKASAGAELRFRPVDLKLGRHRLGLGFDGFVEVGMVSRKLADLFKHAYFSGGPGVLLIWDRFIVFRVEAGFSREGGAVYLQSEHAF